MNQAQKTPSSLKVEQFLQTARQWRDEYQQLRAIVSRTPLEEGFKWGKPCYAIDGSNVVLIHGFKDFCALLFMKGALLKDPDQLLIAQTDNTQATRQIRFTSVEQIQALAPAIEAYLLEAIEVERSGQQVEFKRTEDFDVPAEFQQRLDASPALKAAFEALTPGRQRGYLLHFAGAKQASTRAARVDRCEPRILAGKGLNDR